MKHESFDLDDFQGFERHNITYIKSLRLTS